MPAGPRMRPRPCAPRHHRSWASSASGKAITTRPRPVSKRRAEWLGLGNKSGLANTLYRQGVIAEYRGDDALAEKRCEEILVLFREIEDQRGIFVALENLSDTAYRRGDYQRA